MTEAQPAPRSRWLRATDGEDGVSLVELLVAVSLLAITMMGFTASMISGLTLSRNNNARAIAANVLDERMSELGLMDFAAVGDGTFTRDRGPWRIEVRQETEMVPLSSSDSACDAPTGLGATPAYLRVTLTATWNNMGGTEPVVSETVITPPVAAYDPYMGHVSVKVLDRDAVSQDAMTVNIEPVSGGGGALVVPSSQETSADGCVFFPNLQAGTYAVWLHESGYVDYASGESDTRLSATPTTVTVAPSTTSAVQFTYDEAASLALTLPSSGALPESWPVPVSIANPNYGPDPGKPVRWADVTALAAKPVFPYAAGYGVFAGCAEHDPDVWDPLGRLQVDSNPGEVTTAELPMGLLRVEVVDQNGQPVADQPLRVDGVCDGSALALDYTPRTGADGRLDVQVPYGDWTATARGRVPVDAWPALQVGPTAPAVDVRIEVDLDDGLGEDLLGGGGSDDDDDDEDDD